MRSFKASIGLCMTFGSQNGCGTHGRDPRLIFLLLAFFDNLTLRERLQMTSSIIRGFQTPFPLRHLCHTPHPRWRHLLPTPSPLFPRWFSAKSFFMVKFLNCYHKNQFCRESSWEKMTSSRGEAWKKWWRGSENPEL